MVELNKTTVGDNSENGAHNMVKLTIDNCEVVVPEHTTILDAAKSVGIQIPTLCYLRDLNEIGGCRLQQLRARWHGGPHQQPQGPRGAPHQRAAAAFAARFTLHELCAQR